MRVEDFVEILESDFYTGVPDSQLKALCDYLMERYGISQKHHIIAANEGNCTALAAGYHLATGKVPVVYMQNSGEGNMINPAASLLHEKVYAIPMIFVIGWRGEPDVHDEPQHVFQGEITLKLLEDMDISYCTVNKNSTKEMLSETMKEFRKQLKKGKNVAFVIRKGALTYEKSVNYENTNCMMREEIIRHITAISGTDPIVSTTGKASRELFEIREAEGKGHRYDFLTVGSMGHSSSIALGIAFNKPEKKIWCIDGDGAVLMHMGAMALIGANKPANFVHIIINNSAHETVGGMPTAAGQIDLTAIARGCGYPKAVQVSTYEELDTQLQAAKAGSELTMIEVLCSIGARENLGRPTTTARKNKEAFMEYLRQ